MTKKIALTSTVSDPRTLPLLLKSTDDLASLGLLDHLRVVDATGTKEGAVALRGSIPIEGTTGTRVVTVDTAYVKKSGKKYSISPGDSGYRHKKTGFLISTAGEGASIVGRGKTGFIVGFAIDGRPSPSFELVLSQDSVFFRQGRGGGTVLAEMKNVNGTGDGVVWRGLRVEVRSNEELVISFDSGETLVCPVPGSFSAVELTTSAPPSGVVDIVCSELPLFELAPGSAGVDRRYASYFSCPPAPVDDGIEVVSNLDVVYIDAVGWKSVIGGSGLPVFLGDPSYVGILRRMGIVRGSESAKDVHASFLSRSGGILRRTEIARESNVEMNLDDTTTEALRGVRSGLPAVLCVVDKETIDTGLLDGYSRLLAAGPVGESLDDRAEDVVMYLDSIVSRSPQKVDLFFHELVEVLPRELRVRLVELLSR